MVVARRAIVLARLRSTKQRHCLRSLQTLHPSMLQIFVGQESNRRCHLPPPPSALNPFFPMFAKSSSPLFFLL